MKTQKPKLRRLLFKGTNEGMIDKEEVLKAIDEKITDIDLMIERFKIRYDAHDIQYYPLGKVKAGGKYATRVLLELKEKLKLDSPLAMEDNMKLENNSSDGDFSPSDICANCGHERKYHYLDEFCMIQEMDNKKVLQCSCEKFEEGKK